MRILVAEDDAWTAMAVQLALQAAGHEVLGPVASVEHGIDVAEITPPELALLDVTLAGHGSGLELARHLRERHRAICLLATALPEEALRGAGVAVGVLRKPYDPLMALRSVEVVQRLMAGETVQSLPRGLLLFTPPGVSLSPPL